MAASRQMPPDFRRALRQSLLLDFFLECAYVHRAGYLSWIAAANRRETRRLRIQQAIVRLLAQHAEETAAGGGSAMTGHRHATVEAVHPGLDDVRQSA